MHACSWCSRDGGGVGSGRRTEPHPTPYSLCGRKYRYPNEAAAKAIRKRKSARLRVYACPRCGGWHLTKGDYTPPKPVDLR